MSEEANGTEPGHENGPPDQQAGPTGGPPDAPGPPSFFREFFLFLREEKIWWIAPMILVLVLVAVLLLVGRNSPALAPFLYPLF